MRAILHARIPAALKLLLLALLAAFPKATTPGRTLRTLRQDWLFSANTDFSEDVDSAQDPYVLRRLLRLRAELGWLLRRKPHHGMALSGHRAPELCLAPAARAPPWPHRARIHPESVAETPRTAAMTHARKATLAVRALPPERPLLSAKPTPAPCRAPPSSP